MSTSRKLNVVVRLDRGGDYETFIESRPRTDGRLDAVLEFRPVDGGPPLRTNVQTTQRTQEDVEYWAAGLSVTHIEDAFASAAAPIKTVGAAMPALPSQATPVQSDDRLRHLEPIERHVLSAFQARRTSKIGAKELFDRGPYANADLVRAFEHLEKEDRLLVRFTENGTDWLALTPNGAGLLALPQPATSAIAEPPKPQA